MDTDVPRYRVLLYALALGIKLEDIAEELGLPVQAAYSVIRSPLMAEELRKVRDKVRKMVLEAADGTAAERELIASELSAAQTLSGLLGSKEDKTALQAASKILEIRGIAKPTKVEHTHKLVIPEKQAELLLETMKMLTDGNGNGQQGIVDVEAHVVNNGG